MCDPHILHSNAQISKMCLLLRPRLRSYYCCNYCNNHCRNNRYYYDPGFGKFVAVNANAWHGTIHNADGAPGGQVLLYYTKDIHLLLSSYSNRIENGGVGVSISPTAVAGASQMIH